MIRPLDTHRYNMSQSLLTAQTHLDTWMHVQSFCTYHTRSTTTKYTLNQLQVVLGVLCCDTAHSRQDLPLRSMIQYITHRSHLCQILSCSLMQRKRWNDPSRTFKVTDNVNVRQAFSYYTVSQKKEATKLLQITFSNLNRFSKFFHCWIEDEYFQQNCVIFSTTP